LAGAAGSTSAFAEALQASDASDAHVLLFDMTLGYQSSSSLQLGLKQLESPDHGLRVAPSQSVPVTVTAGLSFPFSFGIDLTPGLSPEEAFFVRGDALTLTGHIDEGSLAFPLETGFLGTQVLGGSVQFEVRVDATLTNPDDDPAGNITLAELWGTSLAALVTTEVARDEFTFDLPLKSFATSDGVDRLGIQDVGVTITGQSLSGSELVVTATGPGAESWRGLQRIEASGMHGVLDSLVDWFGSYSQIAAFRQEIPGWPGRRGSSCFRGETSWRIAWSGRSRIWTGNPPTPPRSSLLNN
jgi:hypothetical protein